MPKFAPIVVLLFLGTILAGMLARIRHASLRRLLDEPGARPHPYYAPKSA